MSESNQQPLSSGDAALLAPLLAALRDPENRSKASKALEALLRGLGAECDISADLPRMHDVLRSPGIDGYLKGFFTEIRPSHFVRGLGHSDGEVREAAARLLLARGWRPSTEQQRASLLDASLRGLRSKAGREVRAALAALRPESGLGGAVVVAGAAGDAALVHLLRDAGADTATVDAEGYTALLRHLERKRTSSELFELLIRRGQAGGTNARGESALHVAARRGHLKAIERLLEVGADPRARDAEGRTPLASAEQARVPVPVVLRLRQATGWRAFTPDDLEAAVLRQRSWAAVAGGGRWVDQSHGQGAPRWVYQRQGVTETPQDLSCLCFNGLATRGLELEWADLHGSTGRKLSFRRARLTGSLLAEGDFRGASFRGASLARVDFTRALLAECDFCGADLSGVNFEGADLTGALFLDAILEGAVLSSGQLTQTRRDRWRIECVKLREESVCGPDYNVDYEFRVIDQRSGKVFRTFERSVEEVFLAGHYPTGTKDVVLAADGQAIVVTYEDSDRVDQIPLPE